MSSSVVETPIVVARHRENVVVNGEIVRHRRASRLIHWSVALTFFLCVFTGMPIWTPIFHWMAAMVGAHQDLNPPGYPANRNTAINADFTRQQQTFFGNQPKYQLGIVGLPDWPSMDFLGKYNPGQKLFFWAVTLGAFGFLVSGVVMWFPLQFPPIVREIAILLHDITFICFFVGVVMHIYLGTAAEPGTFRSMVRGTVTRSWARLHHPGWLKDVDKG